MGAMTKIGEKRIHKIRCRGGNRKVRVLDVTYNASNNELVRTKTLVKGAIVLIDAHAFKSWYEGHYGVKIGLKKDTSASDKTAGEPIDLSGKSPQVQKKLKERQ